MGPNNTGIVILFLFNGSWLGARLQVALMRYCWAFRNSVVMTVGQLVFPPLFFLMELITDHSLPPCTRVAYSTNVNGKLQHLQISPPSPFYKLQCTSCVILNHVKLIWIISKVSLINDPFLKKNMNHISGVFFIFKD